jgi:hypothetical protein
MMERLGRYRFTMQEHQPTAGINIDTIDNLAKKNPNTITVKNPSRFLVLKKTKQFNYQGKPQLDFVRKNCQYHYRRFR